MDATIKTPEGCCNWLENRVVSWFDRAAAECSLAVMAEVVRIMAWRVGGPGGAGCLAVWLAPAGCWGGRAGGCPGFFGRGVAESGRERTIIQRYVASRPMFLDLSDEVAGRGASAAGKYDVAAQMKPLRTLLRCGAGLPGRCWAAAGLLTTPSCGQ